MADQPKAGPGQMPQLYLPPKDREALRWRVLYGDLRGCYPSDMALTQIAYDLDRQARAREISLRRPLPLPDPYPAVIYNPPTPEGEAEFRRQLEGENGSRGEGSGDGEGIPSPARQEPHPPTPSPQMAERGSRRVSEILSPSPSLTERGRPEGGGEVSPSPAEGAGESLPLEGGGGAESAAGGEVPWRPTPERPLAPFWARTSDTPHDPRVDHNPLQGFRESHDWPVPEVEPQALSDQELAPLLELAQTRDLARLALDLFAEWLPLERERLGGVFSRRRPESCGKEMA